MGFPAILLIAVALGADAFSLALGIGLKTITPKRAWEVALIIGLFHVFMPLLGLHLGAVLGHLVGNWAAVLGALILITIGANLFLENWAADRKVKIKFDLTNFWPLICLAASVSVDSLTVGLGLGSLQVNIVLTVLTMGLMAVLMTLAGFFCSHVLSRALGQKADLCAGLILMLIGLKLLF
jgi:putative Mn2+ efflux pump MntP